MCSVSTQPSPPTSFHLNQIQLDKHSWWSSNVSTVARKSGSLIISAVLSCWQIVGINYVCRSSSFTYKPNLSAINVTNLLVSYNWLGNMKPSCRRKIINFWMNSNSWPLFLLAHSHVLIETIPNMTLCWYILDASRFLKTANNRWEVQKCCNFSERLDRKWVPLSFRVKAEAGRKSDRIRPSWHYCLIFSSLFFCNLVFGTVETTDEELFENKLPRRWNQTRFVWKTSSLAGRCCCQEIINKLCVCRHVAAAS